MGHGEGLRRTVGGLGRALGAERDWVHVRLGVLFTGFLNKSRMIPCHVFIRFCVVEDV